MFLKFYFSRPGLQKLQRMLAVLCPFMIRQQLAGVHNSLIELGGVGDTREGQGARAWVWVWAWAWARVRVVAAQTLHLTSRRQTEYGYNVKWPTSSSVQTSNVKHDTSKSSLIVCYEYLFKSSLGKFFREDDGAGAWSAPMKVSRFYQKKKNI